MATAMRSEAHELASRMRRHWWYRGRRLAVDGLLRRGGAPRGGRVLDFGCGTGHMGAVLARYGSLFGVEASAEALGRGAYGDYESVTRAEDLDAPGFPSGPFTLISCLDVLEHVEDDADLLARLTRMLTPGGRIVVSVPMWPELYGPSDEAAGHHRRYTPAALTRLIDAAGLSARASSGYVVALLPIARRRREQEASGSMDASEQFEVPAAPVNAALSAVSLAEGALARWVPLPAGLSWIVVASRRMAAEEGETDV
ncbi:MAG TPA: class I SAM-dependent methyltransferase [Coriobacteriia bacterium]|jgi:2-polyprenyl-3-methyl-5-hydroxy-6-metoxy-1,4-benzoquinol methylase